jgi:hypothetical protein
MMWQPTTKFRRPGVGQLSRGRSTVLRVGFIYAFRVGDSNEFKVGQSIDLKKRQKAHQVGNSRKLTLFDSIEHPDYKEGEKHLKKLLANHRLEGGTGTFGLSDEELTAALAATRVYLDEELPRLRRVAEYSKVETTGEMLAPTDPIRVAFARLQEVREARNRLRPAAKQRAAEQQQLDARHTAEQDELDTRYRDLDTEYRELEDEEARLRTIVMGEIGAARGIEGIATWETVYGRGKFDEEWLRDDEPEMFEKYRTRFDGAFPSNPSAPPWPVLCAPRRS